MERLSELCDADDHLLEKWGETQWLAPLPVGQGDFPRISVAPDGFVYVTFRPNSSLMVSKFSQCSAPAGFALLFTQTIDTIANEGAMCPLPGLDRCLSGNTTSSYTLAADDNFPIHLYVAFAENNGPNNDNIIVRDSTDGGTTWRNRQVLNSAVAAPRFMPWVCTAGATAYVTWYDRRAATAAANDLTDYYMRGIYISAQQTGPMVNATLEPEVNLSINPDPQCAGGAQGAQSWPGGVAIQNDSESCSIQPQLAGRCVVPNTGGQGSKQACDFDEGPACPAANEVCSPVGGQPKYGDYTGNACAGGRIFTAWPSGTALSGSPQPTGIRVVTSTVVLPRLTVTKSVQPSGDGGRFDLQIDGSTRVTNVGDQGKTDAQAVDPGTHTVGEVLGSHTAPVYMESIDGDCARDGTVALTFGDSKTCVVTNIRMSRDECLADCRMQFEDCIADSGRPPAPTPAMCRAALRACNGNC